MALKTWSSLALVLATPFALGACGGDGPSSASATTVAPPSTAPATTAPTTEAAPPPAAAETTPRTTATQRARSPAATQEQAPPPAAPAETGTTPPEPAPAPESAPATTAPRAPEPEPAAEAAETPIEEVAVMRLVHRASPREYTQEGTVTGTFDGTMRLQATITNRGVVVEFVATVEGGTIEGRGVTRPIITGSPLAEIDGTMAIVGGSGRFAAIRGRRLSISGRARLDGTYARVRLAGTVTY